jgi:hypothetical protein
MNSGRVAAAAVVARLVCMGLSALVNTVLLADLHAPHASLFRPADQMKPVAAFAASLVGFLV